MNSSSKLLARTVAAVCALGALFASASSAQEFAASEYPAAIEGAQVGEHVFTLEKGFTFTCPTAFLAGEIAEQTGELEGVVAKYGNEEPTCKIFGILNGTVKMNSCTYTFVDEESVSSGMEHVGSADVACSGTPITIVAGTCEVQIGSQTDLGPVHYKIHTIEPPDPDILTVITTIENEIKYNKTKDGLFCPLSGTGTKEDGSYESTTEVKANAGGNPRDAQLIPLGTRSAGPVP